MNRKIEKMQVFGKQNSFVQNYGEIEDDSKQRH